MDLTPEFHEFNPVSDADLIAVTRAITLAVWKALLTRLVKPLTSKEAEQARHPSQVRPLTEPT